MSNDKLFETIVLDLDNSVVRQKKLINQLEPSVLNLTEQSEMYRYFCRNKDMIALRENVTKSSKSSKPKLIFYGSGDYHNLAYIGLSIVDEPVTVIHFDNHTDFWRFPLKNCYHTFGSWVVWAFTLPNVRKVIQFGVDGDLDTVKGIPVGTYNYHLDFLLDKKVEMYPNSMNVSTFWGRIKGETECVKFIPSGLKTKAIWNNLNSNDLVSFLDRIIETIPTDSVYFTIDKDTLLEKENFAGYWGFQGTMNVERMLKIIEKIASSKRVIGVDICGDGSTTINSKSFIKKLILNMKDKGHQSTEYDLRENIEMNESVNLRIVDTLSKYVR